jgi:hypothetical protein
MSEGPIPSGKEANVGLCRVNPKGKALKRQAQEIINLDFKNSMKRGR